MSSIHIHMFIVWLHTQHCTYYACTNIQALVLPQTFATLVGGLVVSHLNQADCEDGLGYIVLFVLTALYFFLSGVFVMCIRNVR